MQRPFSWFMAVLFAASLSFTAFAAEGIVLPEPGAEGVESVADPVDGPQAIQPAHRSDNLKSPNAARQFELRQQALRQKLAGKASGKVHQVAKGQFVELELERNDRVFVILADFGVQTSPLTCGDAGPAHNSIVEPNRALDNSTIWQADYNREHYEDMYFNQMVDYYAKQSSGRYTINGQVTEWVRVPYNEARYGANTRCDTGTAWGTSATWALIADAVNLWTNDQIASGKTLDEVKAYLQTFDQWDRYDFNGNGNFNEPDGYIDHFQIVHAGAGEETGGGAQGAHAIWSHRWFAYYNLANVYGPAGNVDGGIQFGGGWGSTNTGVTTVKYGANPTGIWVGDYTIQPENGGLGVFAHEYGHDLNLPDHYDTAGGSNSTGFWNLMSSGSYLGDGTDDIGSAPGDMSAWDKLQLGWLNYELAEAGKFSTHKLGPAETNTKQAQGLVVLLPSDKNVTYVADPRNPVFGSKAWWGGRANNLDATMVRTVDVPVDAPVLTMRLQYTIEANWDYAYVSVSTDGGASWTNLAATGVTTTSNPNRQNLGNGITGSTNGAWRTASFNMAPYAGQQVQIRIRYRTDPFVNEKGILVDEIALGSFTDGAEAGANGWTLNGFSATSGVEPVDALHFYVAEFRQYRTYDKGLQTGPYTFGSVERPDWVEHYPYQDGLLISYADHSYSNNNTSQHPGEGLVLPIDAHPQPLVRFGQIPGGPAFSFLWSSTIQSYDSTFGLEQTDPITLPYRVTYMETLYGFSSSHPSLPAVPVFNDLTNYWSPLTPAASVILPKTGTSIRVVSTSAQDSFMQVHVVPSN